MTIDPKNPLGPAPPPPRESTGCGTILAVGCSVVLAIVLVTLAGVTTFMFHLIKKSDVYQEALQRAQADPQVVALLGSPVEPRWWVSGSFNMREDGGHARFTIPLEGPRGRARLHARALRDRRRWVFDRLYVEPDGGGARIDLPLNVNR